MSLLMTLVLVLSVIVGLGTPAEAQRLGPRPAPGTMNREIAGLLLAVAADVEVNQAIVDGVGAASTPQIRKTSNYARQALRGLGIQPADIDRLAIDQYSGVAVVNQIAWLDRSVPRHKIVDLVNVIRRLVLTEQGPDEAVRRALNRTNLYGRGISVDSAKPVWAVGDGYLWGALCPRGNCGRLTNRVQFEAPPTRPGDYASARTRLSTERSASANGLARSINHSYSEATRTAQAARQRAGELHIVAGRAERITKIRSAVRQTRDHVAMGNQGRANMQIVVNDERADIAGPDKAYKQDRARYNAWLQRNTAAGGTSTGHRVRGYHSMATHWDTIKSQAAQNGFDMQTGAVFQRTTTDKVIDAATGAAIGAVLGGAAGAVVGDVASDDPKVIGGAALTGAVLGGLGGAYLGWTGQSLADVTTRAMPPVPSANAGQSAQQTADEAEKAADNAESSDSGSTGGSSGGCSTYGCQSSGSSGGDDRGSGSGGCSTYGCGSSSTNGGTATTTSAGTSSSGSGSGGCSTYGCSGSSSSSSSSSTSTGSSTSSGGPTGSSGTYGGG